MNRYYYSKDGNDVQGPVSEDDLVQMHSANILTDAVQICREGSNSWESISKIISQPHKSIPTDLPVEIKGGNGSYDSPFVIETGSHVVSALMQKEMLNAIFGADRWKLKERNYSESKNGLPGNKDMCDFRVTVDGQEQSVWFDLYLVTRLLDDPKYANTDKQILQQANITQIAAKTSVDACNQIREHLKKYTTTGWVSAGAFALIDGWRNEYRMKRGDQNITISFDMRPTLQHVSGLELTMATMLVSAQPNTKLQGKNLMEAALNLNATKSTAGQKKSFFQRFLGT